MNTYLYPLITRSAFICLVLIAVAGCKKSDSDEGWVETHDVAIQAYKSDPENGKQYLDIIYENIGTESFRKMKVQLITRTGSKFDTIERTIVPENVFRPKEKHLLARPIGQEPATFEEVKVGKVWAIPDKK